jgi:ATP-dependent RNA helicase DDX60
MPLTHCFLSLVFFLFCLQVVEWRAAEDMIVVQLTAMSDRLPPLSPFTSGFRLDDWQIRVLKMIDKRQSVVICAPTSSGKTVISTYVASLGRALNKSGLGVAEESKKKVEEKVVREDGLEEYDSDDEDNVSVAPKDRVLFVVPTEPLVWQVAAHFAKHILAGNVALVTNQLTYSPHKKKDEPPAVVVGTPMALESALTKIRGNTSSLEGHFDMDKSKMVGGFDHYGWVVYDEIHSLDGEEGEALQRLIRLMNCNFLALSATVGNAEQLRTWMEEVRGQQLQVEVVNAPVPPPPAGGEKEEAGEEEGKAKTREEVMAELEAADASRLVKIQEHQGRFLNIQRHLWTDSSTGLQNALEGTTNLKVGVDGTTSVKLGADAEVTTPDKCSLQLLHPLSAVTLDFLQNDGFRHSSLPMTPQDSYVMWRAMEKAYPKEAIAKVDPHHFFADIDRITLQDSKVYEDHLKSNLESLATSHPVETQSLLDKYQLADSAPDFDICELALSLKAKQMHPCLIFHLNVFDLISLFRQLLEGLERRQAEKHPNHYTGLRSKAAGQKSEQENAAKQSATNKEMQDDIQAGFLESGAGVIDETAPHHEFCFCPGGPISYTEYNDICMEVERRDKFQGDIKQHALMRALRRGIGFYFNDHHFTAYRIAIMRLAMQGKLGIVLSDNSLAYGVNMPFRSCVFAGEMGGELDSLMAQQMAGRSGRRGLDTQGHLVYAGASASFVQDLMLARIPAILGREPRYHTVFLQEMLSKYSNPAGYFEHQGQVLGERPLTASIKGDTSCPHFRQASLDALLMLHLIEECDKLSPEDTKQMLEEDRVDFTASATPSGYRPCVGRANCAQLWMIWEMRGSLPESLVIGCLLNDLYMEFIYRQADAAGDNEHVQITFLAYLVLMLERRPFETDLSLGFHPQPMSSHPFITGKPDLAAKLAVWENKIGDVQTQIGESDVYQKEWMMLPEDVSAGKSLDATIFDCIVSPGNVSALPPRVKQYVKETLTSLSIKLIHFRNNLRNDTANYASDAKFGQFEMLARKCYSRVQYISKELIQEFMDFPDASSAENEKKLK